MQISATSQPPSLWMSLQNGLEILWRGPRVFLGVATAFIFIPDLLFRLIAQHLAGSFALQMESAAARSYLPVYEAFSVSSLTLGFLKLVVTIVQLVGWVLVIRLAHQAQTEERPFQALQVGKVRHAVRLTLTRAFPVFLIQQLALVEWIIYGPMHIVYCMIGMAYIFVALQGRRPISAVRAAVMLRYASSNRVSKVQLLFMLLGLNLFMVGMQIAMKSLAAWLHYADVSLNFVAAQGWNALLASSLLLTWGGLVKGLCLSAADCIYQVLLITTYYALYQLVRPRIAV
ncbi:MAG: hypothetical protein OXT67_10005 [Zetaproteobacteria bacterium]|nr:hypothetical protein [Zetaproteobacteria bacterium]